MGELGWTESRGEVCGELWLVTSNRYISVVLVYIVRK